MCQVNQFFPTVTWSGLKLPICGLIWKLLFSRIFWERLCQSVWVLWKQYHEFYRPLENWLTLWINTKLRVLASIFSHFWKLTGTPLSSVSSLKPAWKLSDSHRPNFLWSLFSVSRSLFWHPIRGYTYIDKLISIKENFFDWYSIRESDRREIEWSLFSHCALNYWCPCTWAAKLRQISWYTHDMLLKTVIFEVL